MKMSHTNILKLAAVAALAGFAFTGCMTQSEPDPTLDGGNVVAAQEANNMGAVLNESASSPKIAAVTSDTDTVTKEKIIVSRHYDAVCQCFVRSTQFLNKKGFERQRLDSIWLDSSGYLLSVFTPGHADSITHIRHVTRINGNSGKNVDITFKTTLVKKLVGGLIVYQWTGTMTGTFNGTEFKSSSFSITRTWTPGAGFGYAEGTLSILRDNYEIVILFSSGSANCTVNHSGKLLRTTHIDKDDNET